MSNVIRFIKKAFTLGVVSTTIMWSSMVSVLVPSVAQAAVCPVLKPGDMIKVVKKAAIYAVNNKLEVLYFPSGDEFKSQTALSASAPNQYAGYISVDQACYDSLKVPSAYPGGVNFRAGSYVVKRPSSDQLYVVEPNNSLAKVTPEVAKALYGSNYKVMTVADAFWPHYVNRGADVTEAKPHPGMLVSNGGKTWYVDTDMKLREVSASGLTANRFKSAFVHVVTDAMISGYSFGDKIDAEVPAISDRTQGGGVVSGPTTGGTVTPSGSLTVALASDNPFAKTVVSDTADGAEAQIGVLKLVFTAGSDGDVKVTSLKFKRGGISADSDISNMHLYEGDTLLASNPSIATNMITFSSAAGLFTVAKGTSKTVALRLDLKNNVSSGKTIMFSLDAKDSVAPAASTGSFPLAGNTFTTASVTDLGKLAFSNVSPTAAGSVDPGTNSFEAWKFKAVGSDQDTEVRKLKFTLVGSINAGDLKNFKLMDGGTQIGATVAEMTADKTVTLDLAAAPFVVLKGVTKNLSLTADVVSGTNRTFYASIQNGFDIVSYDRNYSVFLKTNGTDSFTIVQAGGSSSVNWTINTGTLTQTVATDSPNGNVASSSVNVTLAKFNWKANGEDIKVSSLSVSSTSASNSLSNVKLIVGGSQVGTTIATVTANGVADTNWGTFGNSFIIKAGTSAVVEIKADLTHTTISAGETVVAGVVLGSSNAQGLVSLTNINTVAQNGNTLTVRGGTVTVTKNSSFGNKTAANPTGPVNASDVMIGSFVITAGAGENVTVSQIKLADGAASTCIGTYLQNLKIKNAAGQQLGATVPNPSSSCASVNTHTFSISPAFSITNGAQYVVNVFADLKAALSTATNVVDVDAVTAQGQTTGTDASASSQALALQDVVISSAGNVMVQTDADTPVADNHLMSATDKVIGKFKISASSTEAINITQLVVSARFSTGATGTVKNIRLVDDLTGAQVGPAVSAFDDTVAGTNSATTTYSHATFGGLSLQIAKGASKILAVKVDFTSYEDSGLSTTGQTLAPAILNSYYGAGSASNNPITATGASSGSSVTAVISMPGGSNLFGVAAGAYGSTTTLYRAKLTTAWASDTPTGASSPSTAQVVGKFVISNQQNSGSYIATVNYVNFNLSTTISQAGGTNTARTLTVYKDSLSTTAVASSNFLSTQTFGNTGFTTWTSTVDVSAGASKTFYVTLDTTDAASTKSLSIRIPSAGVTWTDGVSTSLTVMSSDLPLIYKTFTY